MFGAYFELELSPWDFAAGRLFVEEAGGRVTTCRGEPLPLARTDILASNGPLHDAVLDIVGQHFPARRSGVNVAVRPGRVRRSPSVTLTTARSSSLPA